MKLLQITALGGAFVLAATTLPRMASADLAGAPAHATVIGVGDPITFDASGLGMGGARVTWWMGDGTVAVGGNQTVYSYRLPGTYSVAVVWVDGNGVEKSARYNIYVREWPQTGRQYGYAVDMSEVTAAPPSAAGAAAFTVRTEKSE